jgi:hypothetical protein
MHAISTIFPERGPLDHSYEEIRTAVLDIILGREQTTYSPDQFGHLIVGVEEVLDRREGRSVGPNGRRNGLSQNDSNLVREVFWDLFLQRIITLGIDDSNRAFPFFSLSHTGRRLAEGQNPYLFHDVDSYTRLIQSTVPNLNAVTLLYLQEAAQAFRSGCLLAATVLVGVASEHTFLLLLEALEANPAYGPHFHGAVAKRTLLEKFRAFQAAFNGHVKKALPRTLSENIETELEGILSVIRRFRNDAGHPSGAIPSREQTYMLLQLFVPYCQRVYGVLDFVRGASSATP